MVHIQRTYLMVGGALGGILGLVGILNFINSIATAILTRRTELAMLQSVGMTTKQLRKMLIGEGLWYIALTAFITLTLGNLLSAFITNAISTCDFLSLGEPPECGGTAQRSLMA